MSLPRLVKTLALAALTAGASFAASLELGANFNEHLTAAGVPALDATGVRWVRGFVPVGEFVDVDRVPIPAGARDRSRPRRNLSDDEGLATLRAAAASGRKVAVTLKWDFKVTHWRVPTPDSRDERTVFAFAVDLVRAVKPDLLLLVNEVFIDTAEEDMNLDASGTVPMVRFLQRLATHVAAAKLTQLDGSPLAVSCGGFTRLDLPAMREHPATRALMPWLATSPHLTHANFHMHQYDLAQFESAARFMHEQTKGRPLVVTEFSLVWAFQRGLKETLAANEAGRAFAAKYHREPNQTCRDYLDAASKNPVTEDELHAFLGSRTWFDPQALEKMCRIMEQNGVVLATYAYLQAASGIARPGAPIGNTQPPWRLNPVFQERHAFVPGDARPAVQLGFFETFVKRQQRPSS